MTEHEDRPATQVASAGPATEKADAEQRITEPAAGFEDVSLQSNHDATFDIEIGWLNKDWFEESRSVDGTRKLERRTLSRRKLKINLPIFWLMVGTLLILTLLIKPDAFELLLKVVSSWARAG